MVKIDVFDVLAFDSAEEHDRFMQEEGVPLLVLYRSIRNQDLRKAVTAMLQSIVDADAQRSSACSHR